MKNCPSCTLPVQDEGICCVKCSKKYHYSCGNIPEFEVALYLKNKYKTWTCESCVNKYCKKCEKTFSEKNYDSICCEKCERWYHVPCTILTSAEFETFTENSHKSWKCQFCIKNFCEKCDITLHHRENICCSSCNNK